MFPFGGAAVVAAAATLVVLTGGLLGCAHAPTDDASMVSDASATNQSVVLGAAARALFQTPVAGGEWQVMRMPGKTYVPFESVSRVGRPALQVSARRSVSVLRQRFEPGLEGVGALDFSWMVEALPHGADLKRADATDAPVRILLAFDGDRSRWNPAAHRLSELSRLLTGEPLPYATLSYVWSRDDAPESVVFNPRTDRIRKVVVDSGSQHLGQWRDHSRDVRADFIRAFGEEPGPMTAVAVMTDTDNTRSRLRAWYGAMRLSAARAVGTSDVR